MMRDMTKGAPLGHLFLYAVPLLLGNWLQLAYNAVDSIIAGRFIGQDALAAEGVAGPVMNLVILGHQRPVHRRGRADERGVRRQSGPPA